MKVSAGELVGKWGTAEELIAARTGDGFVDLNSIDWQRDAAISRIKFTRARLQRARVDVNFVQCAFQKCEFESVRSEGRFWAADDRWDDCSFVDMQMIDVVSPSNMFSHCSFARVQLVQYTAHETVFDNCMFEDLVLETFNAQKATAPGKAFAKLPPNSVTFRECTFLRPTFRLCHFANVAFENCTVRDPIVDRCDFTGVMGSPAWWSEYSTTDLFTTFLHTVLARIEERLGPDSVSYRNFARYVDRYGSGATKSKDFSEVLFLPEVPDHEIDDFEKDLNELMDEFRTVL